ncbi:immunodominant membrane protein Imp [Candidatus Phytoplasma solani]|uniref:hypothetical protein n=1 Tax=Candidatus Phytoplasma solani TaxID=69896 RepID=UPI0032DB4935
MKFIATKRNKIIVGVICIITSLYLGLGFWISFNPIKWFSPYETWAKNSGNKLVVLAEELKKEKDKNKIKQKIKEIKNQLSKINTFVVERYKNIEKIKQKYSEFKFKYDELNNNIKEVGNDNTYIVKLAKDIRGKINILFE